MKLCPGVAAWVTGTLVLTQAGLLAYVSSP